MERIGDSERMGDVRQLLVALGLLSDAESSLARRSGPSNASCLITADTAIEAMLGWLAGFQDSETDIDRSWGKLYAAAEAGSRVFGAGINVALGAEIRAVHKIRDSAVHHQLEVTSREAERAVRAGRSLLRITWSKSGDHAPSTLADAVADIIQCDDVAGCLHSASAALNSARWVEVVDMAAKALSRARRRTEPPLGGARRPTSLIGLRIRVGNELEELARYSELISERLEQWLVPLSLGTSPTVYWRLMDLLGQTRIFGDGREEVHRRDQVIGDLEAQWAVEQVAQLIFRLWETGALVTDTEMPDERDRLVHGIRRKRPRSPSQG